MIRFLKNVKFEIGYILDRKISLTSFDINAICYNIKQTDYALENNTKLVAVLYVELGKIASDEIYRNSIKSIDGQEDIFLGKSFDKLNDLILIKDELDAILSDLEILKTLAI